MSADSAAEWYARKPWTNQYPPVVARELDVGPEETILGLLLDACERHADRVAFELDGQALTFREWRQRAEHLSRFFVHEWKLEKGDRVVLLMPNIPAFPIALLGAWMAGLVTMSAYTAATSLEFSEHIAAAAPRAIVVLDRIASAFRAATGADQVREMVVSETEDIAGPVPAGGVTFADALARGAKQPPTERSVSPDDLVVMAFTGGTTGVSKAVRTSHRNMRMGVEMLRVAMVEHLPSAGEVAIGLHPFCHSAGLSVNLLTLASRGVTQMLFPDSMDAEKVAAAWRRRSFTFILAGPSFYSRLMAAPSFPDIDFSSLRAAGTGGMALRADVRERWEATTGTPLVQGYGLTETSAPITCEQRQPRFAGSVGFPFPGVELSVRDPDSPTLDAVAPGQIGEIWLRGPFLMAGYHARPDEDARAITPDGWFRTGDLGRVDPNGALYILGRIKDMLLVDGANVYPASIEDAVGAHPGIADVCAVGMPDEDEGERVRLFVVKRDPGLSEADVRAWCEERLADYKQPKRIEFIDALPRSAVDKLLRRELAGWPLA